jgi:hypothetical protein
MDMYVTTGFVYLIPILGLLFVFSIDHILTTPQVQLTSRSIFLLPSRHDRSSMVDVASPGFKKQAEYYCRNHDFSEQPAKP